MDPADQTPQRVSVGELAGTEPLRPLPPVPDPATVSIESVVASNAAVAFRGNRYSAPPGLAGTRLELTHRLGRDPQPGRWRHGVAPARPRWSRDDRAHR